MKETKFKLRKHCTGLVAAAALTCGAGAHAALIDGIVDVWDVTVTSSFLCGTVEWTGNTANNSCLDQKMRWGAGNNGKSGLDITNTGTDQITTNGPAVANTAVTHRNRTIRSGSGSLDKVTLRSTLTLTPSVPAGLSGGIGPDNLDFLIDFMETNNNATNCAGGGKNRVPGVNRNGCADIFVISQDALNFPFFYDMDGAGDEYDPQQYFISFFEKTSGLNPLPAKACTSAGADVPCLGFRTPEKEDTTFQFAAVITTKPVTIQVPAPGVLALLGLGLLGLGFTRRKH